MHMWECDAAKTSAEKKTHRAVDQRSIGLAVKTSKCCIGEVIDEVRR